MRKKVYIVLLASTCLLFNYSKTTAQRRENMSKIKNVVLVHGAFVDGSGWKGVYEVLTEKGYHVLIAQIPLTSLQDDATTVRRALDKVDGAAVLVGHSWGGAVITETSNHPKVAALVYVTAFQPDKGEDTWKWVSAQPALAENGILPPDENGFLYYDKGKFHAGFAGGLSEKQAVFMADSQKPIAAAAFTIPLTVAEWHHKPTFGIVPTADKSINPIILRTMYKRSGTKVTEIEGGSHAVYISHPKEVAAVIESASK